MVTKNKVRVTAIKNWVLWVYPVSIFDTDSVHFDLLCWATAAWKHLLAEWKNIETSLEKSKNSCRMLNKLSPKVRWKVFIRRSKKKHGRTSPDVQFGEFIKLTKIGLEWTMSEMGKAFGKKLIQKIEKENSKKWKWNFRMGTKNHYRESSFLFKHCFLTLL